MGEVNMLRKYSKHWQDADSVTLPRESHFEKRITGMMTD